MKRFWTTAAVTEVDGGFTVSLDGKPMRTPAKRPLLVPTAALAAAIAAEWAAAPADFDPQRFGYTRLANTTLDRIVDFRDELLDEMVGYGAADALCYRAEAPDDLLARQRRAWDPVLDWVKSRYDVEPRTTLGLMPVDQPEALFERLRGALSWRSDAELAALHMLAGGFGSILLALALAEEAVDFATAWTASRIDESYEIEHWGEDDEAAARTANMTADLALACDFLRLARR